MVLARERRTTPCCGSRAPDVQTIPTRHPDLRWRARRCWPWRRCRSIALAAVPEFYREALAADGQDQEQQSDGNAPWRHDPEQPFPPRREVGSGVHGGADQRLAGRRSAAELSRHASGRIRGPPGGDRRRNGIKWVAASTGNKHQRGGLAQLRCLSGAARHDFAAYPQGPASVRCPFRWAQSPTGSRRNLQGIKVEVARPTATRWHR